MLLAELTGQRRHVMATLNGLSDSQLRTPVPPTTWAPIAVVHHLALDVERWWFQAIVADDAAAWAYFEANPNGAWSVPDGTDVAARYDAECAASDAIISAADLDATPAAWPEFLGPTQTIGEIVLHVISETATHAGQLDIVREMIDGHQHLVLD
jgi:uncharacterized damage-inducible protein DinB